MAQGGGSQKELVKGFSFFAPTPKHKAINSVSHEPHLLHMHSSDTQKQHILKPTNEEIHQLVLDSC